MAKRRARDEYGHSLPVPFWGWAVIVIGTIMRLILAQTLELRTDEAYYWTQSKEWVFSTLDHPPMSLWFIKFGTLIFGDTNLGVRVPSIVALLMTHILIIRSVQMTAREPRALYFAILSVEALFFYAHMGILAGPDAALLLFLTLTLYFLMKLEITGEPSTWLLVGLAAGLAALSKYTAIFFAPAIIAYVFINRRNRRLLVTPWPWLAASLAFFIFSPVLIWNAMNDWISFKFQGDRLSVTGMNFTTFADFIGIQFVVVGFLLFPMMIWASIWAFIRSIPEKSGILTLLSLAVLVPFIYFVFRSFGLRINITWPYMIYVPAIIVTALYLDRMPEMSASLASFTWTTTKFGLGLGFLVVGLVFVEYVIDNKPRFGKSDPYGKESGYEEVAQRVLSESYKRRATWLATTDYRTYAMMRWHLRKSDLAIIQLTERSRYVGFKSPQMNKIDDQRGLHIVPETKHNPGTWVHIQTSRERLGIIERQWRGLVYDRIILDVLTPFKPELNPNKSSPLFTPRKLV